jgi:hypothetical protein
MKRYELRWSVCASFEGINPGKYWPDEKSPLDARRNWPASMDSVRCATLEELEQNKSKYDSGLWKDADFVGGDEVEFVECNGILTRKELEDFLDSVDAFYADCDTLGTLGGPLGPFMVPDFSFATKFQAMVSCIRATPVLCDTATGDVLRLPSEWQWEKIKVALKG